MTEVKRTFSRLASTLHTAYKTDTTGPVFTNSVTVVTVFSWLE